LPPRWLVTANGSLAVYRCTGCRLDSSVHGGDAHSAGEGDHFRSVDRAAYDRSVRATRETSYPQLLARVRGVVDAGRWLDVGSSFGWLLERVESSGYRGFGLDPSLGAVVEARAAGLRVCAGTFPDAVNREARFEVISLMDVLEHLADPVSAIRDASRLMSDHGVLIVQVPDRDCLLYGCAVVLARLTGGSLGFALRRLWLAGFDFPHLWYFTAPALRSILELGGMEVLDLRQIPIGSPSQAIDRVRYAGSGRALVDTALAGGVAVLNGLDAALGHGGLIEALARPSRNRASGT
jgi:SAM-dependent methyltransferase